MRSTQSLSHTKWKCKYHLTWIPKYRKKDLYGELRKYLGEAIREMARRSGSEVLEGHLMSDHVHMLVSIPPKYDVSQIVGYQGENRNPYCERIIWEEKEFHWRRILGQRILCQYNK